MNIQVSLDRSSHTLSSTQQLGNIDSIGLRRARQAAEQARAVAAAVAVATAAAAERAISHQLPPHAKHDFESNGTSNFREAREVNPKGGGISNSPSRWRSTPQLLTERALLQHASRGAAGDTPRADLPPQRGSRFVPDALPFHCAADYSPAGPRAPRPAVAQRI
jgi:hypothetical protein